MILVTGGTGFVGREIVKQLAATGHRIRLLVRHPERAAAFAKKHGCEMATGDVLDPASLEAAMQGATAVVHLVGIIMETPKLSFEKAHAQGTAHVLEAAKRAGVRRIVHMSALGTRAGGRSRYHRTKWEAEELVRQSGLDWTIVRPSVIYGPGDKSLNFLAKWMRWPIDFMNFYGAPNLGGGRSHVQPVAVEDVALVFVRALGNESALGKTYDACGPEAFEWRNLLLIMAQRQGIEARLDDPPFLYALRTVLWTALIALPMGMGVCLIVGDLAVRWAVILTTVWAALLLVACVWREFLFYTVPWGFLHFLAHVAEWILPSWLHFGEQLKMLEEDNTGDPAPVSHDLHLAFKSFAETWKAGE